MIHQVQRFSATLWAPVVYLPQCAFQQASAWALLVLRLHKVSLISQAVCVSRASSLTRRCLPYRSTLASPEGGGAFVHRPTCTVRNCDETYMYDGWI